jgi:dTDP-4-dehydrorhamnose 3,5-epimerase
MKITDVGFGGVQKIQLDPVHDMRGSFVRYFCRQTLLNAGLNVDWPQINFSHTFQSGAIRGLHFQSSPPEEIKLITCLSGAVFDVLVDIRPASSTFGKWRAFDLSERNAVALYVPAGFAHGFQCISGDCKLIYMMSCDYQAESAKGVHYNDPDLSISWPLPVTCVSPKDKALPPLQAVR